MVVLVSTLFGAAGGGILLLASLVFDEMPAGLVRSRPWIVGAVGLAGGLLAAEWLGVH